MRTDLNRNMKKTIFSLHPRHYEWLKAMSDKTGASMSWRIRQLIDKEIERERGKTEAKHTP